MRWPVRTWIRSRASRTARGPVPSHGFSSCQVRAPPDYLVTAAAINPAFASWGDLRLVLRADRGGQRCLATAETAVLILTR
jgi:hypothetical protein